MAHFADEVQQAIQQLSSLQNTYGDNLYAPVAQMLYRKLWIQVNWV